MTYRGVSTGDSAVVVVGVGELDSAFPGSVRIAVAWINYPSLLLNFVRTRIICLAAVLGQGFVPFPLTPCNRALWVQIDDWPTTSG